MALLRRDEISRVAEMLFGGDESLIPVLDYLYLSKAHYFASPNVSHPLQWENEGRRRLQWWDTTGYVLTEDPP